MVEVSCGLVWAAMRPAGSRERGLAMYAGIVGLSWGSLGAWGCGAPATVERIAAPPLGSSSAGGENPGSRAWSIQRVAVPGVERWCDPWTPPARGVVASSSGEMWSQICSCSAEAMGSGENSAWVRPFGAGAECHVKGGEGIARAGAADDHSAVRWTVGEGGTVYAPAAGVVRWAWALSERPGDQPVGMLGLELTHRDERMFMKLQGVTPRVGYLDTVRPGQVIAIAPTGVVDVHVNATKGSSPCEVERWTRVDLFTSRVNVRPTSDVARSEEPRWPWADSAHGGFDSPPCVYR